MVPSLLRFRQNRVIYEIHKSKIFYCFYICIWYIMLLCGFLWANIKRYLFHPCRAALCKRNNSTQVYLSESVSEGLFIES